MPSLRHARNTLSSALGAVAVALCLIMPGAASLLAAQESTPPFAFVDVNVVPMDRERVLMRQTVVVQGDRIMAIDPSDEANVPAGAVRIDARGRYLMPGLIDVNAGLLSDGHIAADLVDEELALLVANGITTMLNPSGQSRHLELRGRIARGELLGPRLYLGTPHLTLGGGNSYVANRVLENPTAAVVAVRELSGVGYDFVEVGERVDRPTYDAIALAARQYQVPIVGIVGPAVGLQRALETGHQIESYDQYFEASLGEGEAFAGTLSGAAAWNKDNWELMARVDTNRLATLVRATVDGESWNAPLLALGEALFGAPRTAERIASSPEYQFVSASVRDELLRPGVEFWTDPPAAGLRSRYLELRNRLTLELYAAGGRLLAGSGAPNGMFLSAFGLHREIQAFAAAGLPPFAAIHMATRNPAVFLSRPSSGRTEFATVDESAIRFASAVTNEVDFGVLGVGKRADMVLLAANPLDDVRNTQRIEGVVLQGRWLPRAELDTLIAGAVSALAAAPLLERSR